MTPSIRRSLFVRAVVPPILALLISACAIQPNDSSQRPETFDEALRSCRHSQPGRVNRRVNAPATKPAIARCLRARGWDPQGNPVQPSAQ